MKKFKKSIRLIGLALLIALALMGVGGISVFSTREKCIDNEIRIELVDKKKDEDDGEIKEVE
jgi:hypothetical protein